MEEDELIDWSELFADETGGLLDMGESPPSTSCRIDEIERELMKDDDDDDIDNGEKERLLANEFCDNFLADVLDVVETPESDDKSDVVEDEDEDEDESKDKKRRRQKRNREAALRSRERKKEYVKELEMKSKYLEAECRRLGGLLQWYCAENQSLRVWASAAKQESAVLFLESLLLGSLLCCLCLLLPNQTPLSPPPPKRGGAGPLPPPTKTTPPVVVPSLLQTRTCKASWTKMKILHYHYQLPPPFLC